MQPATATCRPNDQATLWPQRSCSKKISALVSMACQRLGHNADIGNSRLFHCIHHGGESAKRHVFVGTDKNRLMLGIANPGAQLACDFVNVDGIVSEKNPLLFVDAENQPFLGDFFYGASLGDVDLDS